MLDDATFLEWTRGRISPPLTERDHGLSRDVRLCQLALYLLARMSDAKVIIEIGTADGSTTIPLLKAARETGGIVHSVDPGPCGAAVRLVEDFGYLDIWRFHHMTSEEFFRTVFFEQIDFAFIDGDHAADGVKLDADFVLHLLRMGGYCVFHDWHPAESHVLRQHPEPEEYGVMKGLLQALKGWAGTIHAMPMLPNGKGPDNGSEGAFLVLQKANEPGGVEFVRRLWR